MLSIMTNQHRRRRMIVGLLAGILCCNFNNYCNAFAPPSSTILQQHAPSQPLQNKTPHPLLFMMPINDIIQSTTSSSISTVATSSSSASSTLFLLTDSAIAASKNMLGEMLHIPTLWSILAMTSIVALLVAWEESVEWVLYHMLVALFYIMLYMTYDVLKFCSPYAPTLIETFDIIRPNQ